MMDNAERTEKVFGAAVKVFAKYGFRKSTVEDIAAELGMTKGNLYAFCARPQRIKHLTLCRRMQF